MATANLGVRIVLQDSASAGLSTLSAGLGRLGYQFGYMSSLWNSFTPLQQGLAVTTAAAGVSFAVFGSALKYAIQQGETIQNTLTNVSIAIQGADQHSQALQDDIIHLADTGVFGVSQVGDAFVALGEHGLNAEDILRNHVGDAAIYLAEALNSDTVPAADLLSVSLQQYSASADQATNYSNILTAAFYNGIPSVQGLQSAITNAAPQAKFLGISFQDLAIMLDILGKKLGSGEEAGTALRNMLKDLTAPTNNATKALEQLGIITLNNVPALQQFIDKVAASGKAGSTAAGLFDGSAASLLKIFQAAQKVGLAPLDQTFFQWASQNQYLNDKLFDSSGKFLGLKNAVDQLDKALQGMPPEQQASILTAIFNIKGSKGIETLTGDVNNFDQTWAQLLQNFGQTSAQQDAAKQTGTLSGALKEFKTTLADAFGLTGMQIIPTITAFVQHLNSLVDSFNRLPAPVKATVGHFLMVGTAVSGSIAATSGLAFGLSFLGKNAGGILGPFSGLLGMFKNLAGFGPNLVGFLGGLTGPITSLFNILGNIPSNFLFVFKNFGIILPILQMGAKNLFSGGLQALIGGFSSFGSLLPTVVGGIVPLIGSIAAIAAPIIAVIGVIAIIVLLFTTFKKQGMEIVGMLQSAFMPIWNAIKSAVGDALNQIKTAWNQAMPQIRPAINNLVEGFHQAMPVIQFFGKILGGVVVGAIKLIASLAVGIIKAIGPIINVFAGIMKLVGLVGKFVVAIVHGDFGGAFKLLGDMVVQIGSIFKNYFLAIWNIVSGLVSGVINFFKGLWETLVGHSIVWDIVDGIKLAFTMIAAIGQALINTFIMPVLNLFKMLWSGIGAVVNGIISVLEGMLNRMGPIGAWIKNTFVEPIKNAFNSFWDSIGHGIDLVIGFFNNFENSIRGALRGVLGPIESFLSGLTNLPLVGGVFGGVLNILHSIHLAEGGIVTGPTRAIIGEGGESEAVIPLSKLASILSGQGFSGVSGKQQDIHVHIEVGGKEVAYGVVDALTGQLRSNGFARRFR